MPLPPDFLTAEKHWLEESAPCTNVVMTSRARYARNVAGEPFSPHATAEMLERVHDLVTASISRNHYFDEHYHLPLHSLRPVERLFLKESRLISKEMERLSYNRSVYVSRDFKASVMVNEEDHLRLQTLEPGLQIHRALNMLNQVDEELGRVMDFAYSDQLGYLTACPTNLGTGMRISVMMHLPGLSYLREAEKVLKGLAKFGLTARGFYGENSENTGEYYQISNEVTLGKSSEEIEETLAHMVGFIMERELEARTLLTEKQGVAAQDLIWRSYGLLAHARKIDSAEAMKHLSRIRLGIDERLFPNLSHETLNRLVFDLQPGHLIFRHGAGDEAEDRDIRRAALIRKVLAHDE